MSITVNASADGLSATLQIGVVDKLKISSDGTIEALVGPLKIAGAPLPLSREWSSGEQDITSAGLLTLAHPFAAVPKLVTAELVCKTAQYGFVVGDVIHIHGAQQSTSAIDGNGVTIIAGASNIRARFGKEVDVFVVNRMDGIVGTGINLTNANWRMVIRAYT